MDAAAVTPASGFGSRYAGSAVLLGALMRLRLAEEPAWSGSLRGGPMSSRAPPEPGPRVWTNGRFRNVGCAVQPSSDKKREENPGGHVLPTLWHTGKRSSY